MSRVGGDNLQAMDEGIWKMEKFSLFLVKEGGREGRVMLNAAWRCWIYHCAEGGLYGRERRMVERRKTHPEHMLIIQTQTRYLQNKHLMIFIIV